MNEGSLTPLEDVGFHRLKSIHEIYMRGPAPAKYVTRIDELDRWIASVGATPYSVGSMDWKGEPFDSLEACYVAAELENWGGL